MENKFSYSLVGAFVIGFTALFIFIIVWLTVGTEKITYLPYRVITPESVSGLSVNSTVDYNGVDVGIVKKIQLNKHDPKLVDISLEIAEGTPVKEDTVAVLINKGITGLIGVSLQGGSPTSPDLLPSKNDPDPVIKNGPSLAKRLDEAFENINTSINTLSAQLHSLFNEDNSKHINSIISNVDTISTQLAQSSYDIKKITQDTSEIIANAKPKIDRALNAVDSLSGFAESVKTASTKLTETLDNAQDTMKAWTSTASEYTKLGKSVRPVINTLSTEVNGALYSLSQFLNELKQNPNAIIMGKSQPKKGPGE